jgi:uncharacterized protein DUF6660
VKKIAAILAFYVFVLVLAPCFDNPYHQDEATTNIEHVFDGSHSEICSPFCSNHECHSHIAIAFVNTTFVTEQFCEITDVEIITTIPTPYFAIWQPPKIG